MSKAFAGKKTEQAGYAGLPIEQTPTSLRWSLVDYGSKQDAELVRLRAENEKLRAALKPAFLDGWYRGNNLRCTTYNAELDWEVSTTKAALGEQE